MGWGKRERRKRKNNEEKEREAGVGKGENLVSSGWVSHKSLELSAESEDYTVGIHKGSGAWTHLTSHANL